MSKVLEASCVAGVVTVAGVPVAAAEILSEGVGASDGLAILDEDKVWYQTSNATDIKALLVSLDTILQQIILITTSLDAVTVSPGSAAALITQLTLLKTQLALTQETLK